MTPVQEAKGELAKLWSEIRAGTVDWQHAKKVRYAQRAFLAARTQAVESDADACSDIAWILSALFPSSESNVREILTIRGNKHWFELQFSLLCALGDETERAGSQEPIARLAADYLHNVRRSTAAAGWMAGHLLGGHLPASVSLAHLIREAEKARFVAGRWGAVSGLVDTLPELSREDVQLVISHARRLLRKEPSRRQRGSLRWLLWRAKEALAERSKGSRPGVQQRQA